MQFIKCRTKIKWSFNLISPFCNLSLFVLNYRLRKPVQTGSKKKKFAFANRFASELIDIQFLFIGNRFESVLNRFRMIQSGLDRFYDITTPVWFFMYSKSLGKTHILIELTQFLPEKWDLISSTVL